MRPDVPVVLPDLRDVGALGGVRVEDSRQEVYGTCPGVNKLTYHTYDTHVRAWTAAVVSEGVALCRQLGGVWVGLGGLRTFAACARTYCVGTWTNLGVLSSPSPKDVSLVFVVFRTYDDSREGGGGQGSGVFMIRRKLGSCGETGSECAHAAGRSWHEYVMRYDKSMRIRIYIYDGENLTHRYM